MPIVFDGDNKLTNGVINSGTTQNTTSGTAIDFTGIPAGVKRITVMFNGVSLSGSDHILVQIGSGALSTSGYTSLSTPGGAVTGTGTTSASGFIVKSGNAACTFWGTMTITLLTGNTWSESHCMGMFLSPDTYCAVGGGVSPNLAGSVSLLRITSSSGGNAFDAGSVNILYE